MVKTEELEQIYRRCDVSNNGTVDPMSFEEFKDFVIRETNKARKDEIQRYDHKSYHSREEHEEYLQKRIRELSQSEKGTL